MSGSMAGAYTVLYQGSLVILAVALLLCLIRAIRGPQIADRIIAINMMGTLTIISIAILAFLLEEGYLMDIAMIYTMLSFLAVVLLTKIYMGVYRQKHAGSDRPETAREHGEKEAGQHV